MNTIIFQQKSESNYLKRSYKHFYNYLAGIEFIASSWHSFNYFIPYPFL